MAGNSEAIRLVADAPSLVLRTLRAYGKTQFIRNAAETEMERRRYQQCQHEFVLTIDDDGELVDYCIRCGAMQEPNDQSREARP